MKEPQKKLSPEQKRFIQILSSITFKELDILMNRYILGYTLNELALKYKVQLERVRQIENVALKKITLHSTLTDETFEKQKNKRKK